MARKWRHFRPAVETLPVDDRANAELPTCSRCGVRAEIVGHETGMCLMCSIARTETNARKEEAEHGEA